MQRVPTTGCLSLRLLLLVVLSWGRLPKPSPAETVADKTVRVREAGRYRVWVRYLQIATWRGPFELAIDAGGRRVAAKVFDRDPIAGLPDWEYTWQSLDAELPAGEVPLSLAKHIGVRASPFPHSRPFPCRNDGG